MSQQCLTLYRESKVLFAALWVKWPQESQEKPTKHLSRTRFPQRHQALPTHKLQTVQMNKLRSRRPVAVTKSIQSDPDVLVSLTSFHPDCCRWFTPKFMPSYCESTRLRTCWNFNRINSQYVVTQYAYARKIKLSLVQNESLEMQLDPIRIFATAAALGFCGSLN